MFDICKTGIKNVCTEAGSFSYKLIETTVILLLFKYQKSMQ